MEISEDGTVYTVTLGDNYFHDGTPITADDIVFTYNYHIFTGCARVSYANSLVGFNEARNGEAETVEGVQKVDDKTVTFTLTSANNLFMMALANASFGVIPASYFEGMTWTEIESYEDFWKKPIASGAYYVAETHYPNYIVLKAFEDYYDPASVKDVVLTCYADQSATDAAVRAGEIDWYFGTDLEDAESIMSATDDYYMEMLDTSYQRWFWLNISDTAGNGSTHPSLGSARVRQAINMLLDKEAIAAFYGGTTTVLTGHIPTSNPNYNTDLPTWERNVEEAVKILEEENFDFDTPIRIFSNYTDQDTADFLELVKQQLAEGGVQVEYTIDGNWQEYLSTADYDFRYAGGQQAAAVNWYNFIAISGQTDYTKGNYPMDDPEFVAYMTERYDDLITAYKASQDANEQKEILDQLQFNAYEDMVTIPLYTLGEVSLFTNRFSMPVLTTDYYEMADWHFSTWTLSE